MTYEKINFKEEKNIWIFYFGHFFQNKFYYF